MNITIKIPPRLFRHLLAAAIEGGGYGASWLRNYESRVRGDYTGLYIGKPVEGGEASPEDPDKPRSYVGAKALAEGLRLMLESPKHTHAEAAGRILSNCYNAPDADVCLQFATYGKCVRG